MGERSWQSYPDTLFLPQLAAYFNISVDERLGYEPQMTKEEIRRLVEAVMKNPAFSLLQDDLKFHSICQMPERLENT